MRSLAAGIWGRNVQGLKIKITGVFALVVVFNIAAWSLALLLFGHDSLLMTSAGLAFSLGLRHAVDADHIVAIDNVTRKLMQAGKKPVAVGLFFSLGHSTVVAVLSLVLAFTAANLHEHFPLLEEVGRFVGKVVSAGFLLLLAAINIIVLASIVRAFRRIRRGGHQQEKNVDALLARRSLAGRIFARLFHLVDSSWHLYPIGVLLGLGFDTATSIGLLGLSAAEATRGISIWSIMIFPALFAAGMSFVDTIDNLLMLGAYSWSLVKPLRKIYYNITITVISVITALLIGGAELLGLLQERWNFGGGFWAGIEVINGNFEILGCVIVGIFAATWIGSMLRYRWLRYGNAESAE
jgi:high-affinity nickel-transport protein